MRRVPVIQKFSSSRIVGALVEIVPHILKDIFDVIVLIVRADFGSKLAHLFQLIKHGLTGPVNFEDGHQEGDAVVSSKMRKDPCTLVGGWLRRTVFSNLHHAVGVTSPDRYDASISFI